MLYLIGYAAGLIFSIMPWILCAATGGWTFVCCPFKPLLVAAIAIVCALILFRDACREDGWLAVLFSGGLASPFVLHSIIAAIF